MDIDTIRSELLAMRGQWSRIAVIAGVNRKTVERLVGDAAYNPTLATMKSIGGAIEAVRKQASAERVA